MKCYIIRTLSLVGFIALLAPLGLSQVWAQNGRTSVEQGLEAVDRGEALAVMRTAIEYVYREELNRDSTYLARSVKIDPAGIRSNAPVLLANNVGEQGKRAKPASERVRALAEDLATMLGIEIASFEEVVHCSYPPSSPEVPFMANCRFEDEGTDSFVVASIPVIRGSEARVEVRQWFADRGAIAVHTIHFRLERSAGGQWQVTKRLDWSWAG